MDLYKKIDKFIKESEKKKLKPLLVVLGGTASGKTDLSVKIAKKYNGEVISTDSRQVYKYMDIGTAKIRQNEMQGIPHYMIDIVDPSTEFTLADFIVQAKKHITDIHNKSKLPILAGGTGLYTRAICENYKIPSIPPDMELRKKLQEEIEEHGAQYIHDKLEKLDPQAAEQIHPNNHRYVIRAIEIAKVGKNKSKNGGVKYNVLKIGIEWPREKLYQRIDERAAIQIEEGLINETKTLLQKGYDPKLPSMSSLGYPEMIAYIKGQLTLDEALEVLQKNTRNYAKRQDTWFKREKDVFWVEGEKIASL